MGPPPGEVVTVRTDDTAPGSQRETAMASTLPRPVDDDALEPQRPWEELAAELTGEPLSPVGEEVENDARLTEAELEAAAGVQPPPGRID